MNNHTPNSTSIALALELLTEHGMDRVGEAVQIFINEAMQIERSAFLQAAPHERTSERWRWQTKSDPLGNPNVTHLERQGLPRA